MPIENRNLTAGTRLTARYKKQPYSCQVVEGEGGKLRYRLEDGREFKSPSAAGMAVTGHACDGWMFWSVDTATTTSLPQSEPVGAEQEAETHQTAETTPNDNKEQEAPNPEAETEIAETGQSNVDVDKKSVFRKVPNQKGVPEGQVRWHCYACRKTFLFPAGQVPRGCPGHPIS
ncbi:MAG: hypothetical protein WB588_01685 [Dehalococcoidia bacterium]